MRTLLNNFARSGVLLFVLLESASGAAERFIDLSVEIETTFWNEKIHSRTYVVGCGVGTNTWRMEGEFFQNGTAISWFTGKSIVEQRRPAAGSPRRPAVQEWNRFSASEDGNPGRPAGVVDLLLMPEATIAWLAFCSSPCIRREGHTLFPPSSFWKQHISAPAGFLAQTIPFEDALNLPRTLNLYTTNNEPVVQYRVTASTNLAGWTFPLEFYLAQYRPARTNGWELHLTARGKVISIGVGADPHFPTYAKEAGE